MARSSNPKKLALWQGRFRRFFDSGLAVTRFCAAEDVSESSFYYWQKKLGPQARRRSARAEDHSTHAAHHDTRTEGHDACAEDHGVFRAVTVIPAACGVVIRLPGGAQIEVGPEHLDAIRAVVAETVRVDHGQAAERNASSDNPVTRNVSCGNEVNRNISSDNRVTRKASSNNQVTCKASSNNEVIRKRGMIGKRDGSARTSGTVSC